MIITWKAFFIAHLCNPFSSIIVSLEVRSPNYAADTWRIGSDAYILNPVQTLLSLSGVSMEFEKLFNEFHKENPYFLAHFSLIRPFLAAGCVILVWKELVRGMRRRLSGDAVSPGSSMAGALPVRFVNPATVPGMPVAGERTIRFARRDLPYRQITDIDEYRFDDIQPEDTVLDIGANVGAFCIRAARYSDHVTAVEPVSSDILRENIRLNQVRVKVIEGALGDGSPSEISWDEARVTVPTYTLRQIIGMSGGCDFLKCDCEGGEWLIRPEDLAGIRRIEMELHIPPISGPPSQALLEYLSRHYDFEIERRPGHDVMGVMGILHATRRDG